jgi:hypothetical protein
LLGLVTCLVLPLGQALATEPGTLHDRPVVLDESGKLLSWLRPQETAFARNATSAWNFLATQVPVQSNGLKTFYAYPSFSPITQVPTQWLHHPAGLNSMLVESGLAIHAYTGDRSVLELLRPLLAYQIDHGMTPADGVWPNVPYSSSMPGVTSYQGGDDVWACDNPEPCGRGDGYGVIEPDKVGESGLGYLRLYKATGDTRFRDVAIDCADALAANVRKGDATHSPWPMRVHAQSGEIREEYGANVIAPIKLFDELYRLQLGDQQKYQRAWMMAWAWMMEYPMRNNHWSGYFEDIPIMTSPSDNLNQYIPMETARYLMQRPKLDPYWREHVKQLLDFTEKTFGGDSHNGPGLQWGAIAIGEQLIYNYKMGSHTSRFASVNALWFDRTGDLEAKEKAFRSFNWATYMNDGNGAVSTVPEGGDTWFTDGYGDYIRHYMSGMAAVPEWAPPGENHLLGTTSVVQEISYGSEAITYTTFDAEATDVLRVSKRPGQVLAGDRRLREVKDLQEEGYTLQSLGGEDYALRIHHVSSGAVKIDFGPAPAAEEPATGCGCGANGGQTGGAFALSLALVALARRRNVRRS